MVKAPVRHPLTVLASVAVSALFLYGCKSGGDVGPVEAPDKLYSAAAQDLRGNNFRGAIQKLEALESHYPFTNAAKQGQLDLMFAYYKNRETESAIDQADQFIRENPTHPRVDYAYYIRGLTYFESGNAWLERTLRADLRKRPPAEARKSLQAFQTLLQAYPKSPYAADSRQRMIYLRNKLADYDLSVAEYYVKREAYVAALARARGVIETYDGAPAALDALRIMAKCYKRLGIPDLAKLADGVYAANVGKPSIVAPSAAMAGLALGGQGTEPDWAPNSAPGSLAGQWEARLGVTLQNSSSTDFKGGTTVDVDSGMNFQAGVQYHFTDHISAGASLSYGSENYDAKVASDEPGVVYPIKGDLTTTSLMVDGSYNFLTGRWSPFVTAGIGWSWVDTNIATGPPEGVCWWNPWYGYVCAAWQDTKTESGFAYQLGAGVRYDFNESFAVDGLYKLRWIGFDNADGTPQYDGFEVNVGWKF